MPHTAPLQRKLFQKDKLHMLLQPCLLAALQDRGCTVQYQSCQQYDLADRFHSYSGPCSVAVDPAHKVYIVHFQSRLQSCPRHMECNHHCLPYLQTFLQDKAYRWHYPVQKRSQQHTGYNLFVLLMADEILLDKPYKLNCLPR